MATLNAAILGAGNIAVELLEKLRASGALRVVVLVSSDDGAPGLAKAEEYGIPTSMGSTFRLSELRMAVDVILDATNAANHREWVAAQERTGTQAIDSAATGSGSIQAARAARGARDVTIVDLTPAGCGTLVMPGVAEAPVTAHHFSLGTPAAQATVPLVAALARVTHVVYAEVVSTTATGAVDADARREIDDAIKTTVGALRTLGGADEAKAIALVSPAEPPEAMRNVLTCIVPASTDRDAASAALLDAATAVARLAPGYRLSVRPLFEPDEDGLLRVSVTAEVVGIPPVPVEGGGVELLTRAAVAVAERLAVGGGVPS